jgi:hypothetical protein
LLMDVGSTKSDVVDALITKLVSKGFLHIEDASNDTESAAKKRRVEDDTTGIALYEYPSPPLLFSQRNVYCHYNNCYYTHCSHSSN